MSLQAQDIDLTIGGKRILRGVDFTARPGEVTAIVGPNGSGKTSLLRVMTGETEAGGATHLNGLLVTRRNAPQLAAIRGVLPQASRLAFPFQALEVVRVGHQAGPHGADPDVPHQALRAVGLPGFEHRFYQDLSGGEQQRVQLARVLAQIWKPVRGGQPCWLFLDEPVASLDIGHQLGIMNLARDFAQRGGGVVAVMHDLNLTAMFADKVAIMKEGAFIAAGTPSSVFDDARLSDAYGCDLRINKRPDAGMPFILPQTAGG
ncbi:MULTISPECIES: heme ABC transporter ATP-binding protein [unclassified Roseovarius]|uniref:heme ABC transporter ATP-binding protein n=1 Tax=unclassified Roseovarius TaxID=2614913 RepID=UPI00273EC107|nr:MULTISPECIES: heme ABC transporter ATP-binding protein [unclassified Roseovarius]